MNSKPDWKKISKVRGYLALKERLNLGASGDNTRKQKGWSPWGQHKCAKENFDKAIRNLIAAANFHNTSLFHTFIAMYGKFMQHENCKCFTEFCLYHLPRKQSPHVKRQEIRGYIKYMRTDPWMQDSSPEYRAKRIMGEKQRIARTKRTKKARWHWKRASL